MKILTIKIGISLSNACLLIHNFDFKFLSLQNVQVVTVPYKDSKTPFTATCPIGKKVLGCHIKPTPNNKDFENWRQYYPTNDRTCTCYDKWGAR